MTAARKSIIRQVLFPILTGAIMLSSCGESGDTKKETEDTEAKKSSLEKTAIFQVGDEMFGIPSPVQTAVMIKETGANYNKEMLNNSKAAPSYSTKFLRSLNLGIYGADLAYITMYEQTQDAISYMTACQKLADEIGVSSAFDRTMIERFEKNIDNRDSLLILVTEAYRSSDEYLKNNDRNDVGGLILAGGWIEALHFATNMSAVDGNNKVKNRIAEQKLSLENLIKLLQRYANDEDFAYLMEQLIELYYLFDEVSISYVYEKPSTFPDKKLTVINSKSEVNITDEQLETIAQKIDAIRNYITR